jgi:hypothetical protein
MKELLYDKSLAASLLFEQVERFGSEARSPGIAAVAHSNGIKAWQLAPPESLLYSLLRMD